MRIPVIPTGLLLCVLCLNAGTQKTQALSLESLLATKQIATTQQAEATQPEVATQQEVIAAEPVKVEPIVHIVQSGESLIKIADLQKTTWQRLYDKNTQIVDPDVLNIGEKLVVPLPDEELAARTPPAQEKSITIPKQPSTQTTKVVQASTKQPTAARGSSSGNTYSFGYCTWYAKSRRPDLPNNLGNANTWVARASAQGIATGSTPRAGAIGQQGMHVVYVEAVNGDGTILISEMNYKGVGITSSRTTSAASFSYIY